MDETRLKALQIALDLCRGTYYDAGNLLKAAREIEAYLRGRDEPDTPKASPHPAAVHGLAN